MATAPSPKPARRWLRITLRSLLIVILLLQIPLVWFYYTGRAVQRERNALKSLAGSADAGWRAPDQYDPVFDSLQPGSRTVFQERITSLGLEGYFYPVHYLSVSEREYDDSLAEQLTHLPHLKTLHLAGCRFEANASFPDAGLQELKTLNLSRGELPSRLIHSLSKCDSLERLILSESKLDRNAQAALGTLVQIKHLYLDGASLPDADWSFLPSLIRLEYLQIDGVRGGRFPIAEIPPGLKQLKARYCEVSLKGLSSRPSSNLEELVLENCTLSKDDIASLLEVFTHLNSIAIADTGISARERRALQTEFPHVRFR